jgi:hypothetical protein
MMRQSENQVWRKLAQLARAQEAFGDAGASASVRQSPVGDGATTGAARASSSSPSWGGVAPVLLKWRTTDAAKPAMTRRLRPELAIQHSVFQHLRMRGAPGVFAFHPANGEAHIAAMKAAGAFTAVAEGLDRALAVLEVWGLPRGQASITADKPVSR